MTSRRKDNGYLGRKYDSDFAIPTELDYRPAEVPYDGDRFLALQPGITADHPLVRLLGGASRHIVIRCTVHTDCTWESRPIHRLNRHLGWNRDWPAVAAQELELHRLLTELIRTVKPDTDYSLLGSTVMLNHYRITRPAIVGSRPNHYAAWDVSFTKKDIELRRVPTLIRRTFKTQPFDLYWLDSYASGVVQ